MISTEARKSGTTFQEGRVRTLLDVLSKSAGYLSVKGIDSPRLTAELLLSHILQCSRIDLYSQFDKPLGSEELDAYRTVLRRRVNHEPLQYILGEAEFMGLKLFVDRRVLIPRPETEVLVENVVALCRLGNLRTPGILDIGAGSGNVAISLAKQLPGATVDTIDADGDALEVTRKNVIMHGVESAVNLVKMDILRDDGALPQRKYDWVVSNPPYISAVEYKELDPEVRDYEPAAALTDNGDGLSFFKRIVQLGNKLLVPHGGIAVEVAYDQGVSVKDMFVRNGYADVLLINDYDGIGRVVVAGAP